jgi:hypothetical protein
LIELFKKEGFTAYIFKRMHRADAHIFGPRYDGYWITNSIFRRWTGILRNQILVAKIWSCTHSTDKAKSNFFLLKVNLANRKGKYSFPG